MPCFKFGKTAPPAPKVVLANVMMLNGAIAESLDASIDAKLHSKILDDGVSLSLTRKDGRAK